MDRRIPFGDLVRSGFDVAFVRTGAARVVGNQYKRTPPVLAKLSRRTIGSDFRYLRDWMK